MIFLQLFGARPRTEWSKTEENIVFSCLLSIGLSSSSSLQHWRVHALPFFSLFFFFCFSSFSSIKPLVITKALYRGTAVPFTPKQLDGKVPRRKNSSWWQYHNRRKRSYSGNVPFSLCFFIISMKTIFIPDSPRTNLPNMLQQQEKKLRSEFWNYRVLPCGLGPCGTMRMSLASN